MTVNGHWQYKLTILVHKFCVNKDDLRKILFDLWQNGFKLMTQAIMLFCHKSKSIFLRSSLLTQNMCTGIVSLYCQ